MRAPAKGSVLGIVLGAAGFLGLFLPSSAS